MTMSAPSVMPRAMATVLSAFTSRPPVWCPAIGLGAPRLPRQSSVSGSGRRLRARRRLDGRPPGAASGDALVHEPGDVIVEERQGLLGDDAHRLGPAALPTARAHETLHDEAVGRLDEQDLAHPALVEECADRAEHLL